MTTAFTSLTHCSPAEIRDYCQTEPSWYRAANDTAVPAGSKTAISAGTCRSRRRASTESSSDSLILHDDPVRRDAEEIGGPRRCATSPAELAVYDDLLARFSTAIELPLRKPGRQGAYYPWYA